MGGHTNVMVLGLYLVYFVFNIRLLWKGKQAVGRELGLKHITFYIVPYVMVLLTVPLAYIAPFMPDIILVQVIYAGLFGLWGYILHRMINR